MKIAIIGAGPAGLTTGYQLSKLGVEVDLYEASPDVGGLSKTIDLWGYKVDLGPHRFFSNDSRVNNLWLELVGSDYKMVDRLTRIYYKEKFYHYPLKPFDALSKMGIKEATRSFFSYLSEQINPTKTSGDFESWVTSRFGKRLFELFFKSYSEKLWGISCQELDADFASQRIKKLSLYEAIKNAFFKTSQHKTLVDQFAYPLLGTGMVYSRMEDFIKRKGSNVFLNTAVERVIVKSGKAIGLETADGEYKAYDHIVSTMPLSLLVERMPEVPTNVLKLVKKLEFRNTILVYLHIDGEDLFPDNWLYIHSPDLQMGRVTNFRNWLPSLYEKQKGTVLVIEYWCNFGDPLWKMDSQSLIELASEEIKQTGLIKEHKIIQGHTYPIPRCYPVYRKGYKANLQPVESYLSTIENLSVIGRYGAFKYNNQDHSILMGLMAAENILEGKQHNLWKINTDYETYQEQSVITDTGLVIQD